MNSCSSVHRVSMSLVLSIIFFLLLPYLEARNITSGGNSDQIEYEFCPPKFCSPEGPEIRFPFRRKTQPNLCALEGFELSCFENKTLLHLPFASDYYVHSISYVYSTITIMDVHETPCTLQNLHSPNLSNSRFLTLSDSQNYTILNCTENQDFLGPPFDCFSDKKNLVYAILGDEEIDDLPLNCSIHGTYSIPAYRSPFWSQFQPDAMKAFKARTIDIPDATTAFKARTIDIGWHALDGCNECEISGKYCGLNTTSNLTICVTVNHKHSQKGRIVKISVFTLIGAIFLFALLILLVHRYRTSGNEQITQLQVEKFLEDYRTVNPTRYTYNDLKKITSKFKHRLGQGGFGSVFRGKLSNGILVAVKMLENSKGNGEEFINEVATIGRIHHFNIVRLLGFYSEGTRRALIYEFMPNGSLEKLIFSKISKSNHRPLSWEKLQSIAIGVARGIEYLHQGCNQRILHFDIKPHNILLDHNFQPKISDFGLAKLCSKEESIVSLTAARGTIGYIAPELFSRNFGEVSYKSDVFSYGMMLLEMVGCRKNIDLTIENQSQIYFPEWIYNKMSLREELCLEIEVDGDEEIAQKLAIVALWCIQWNPTARPSMPMTIQMLEGDLESLEIPPKPFVSSDVGG